MHKKKGRESLLDNILNNVFILFLTICTKQRSKRLLLCIHSAGFRHGFIIWCLCRLIMYFISPYLICFIDFLQLFVTYSSDDASVGAESHTSFPPCSAQWRVWFWLNPCQELCQSTVREYLKIDHSNHVQCVFFADSCMSFLCSYPYPTHSRSCFSMKDTEKFWFFFWTSVFILKQNSYLTGIENMQSFIIIHLLVWLGVCDVCGLHTRGSPLGPKLESLFDDLQPALLQPSCGLADGSVFITCWREHEATGFRVGWRSLDRGGLEAGLSH